MGKSTIKAFLKKYKFSILAGILTFSAITFYFQINEGGLPECGNGDIVDVHIPALYFEHTKNMDKVIYSKDVTISEPKEITYDKKAGIRNCTGFITVRTDGDIKSAPFTYQVAWLNDKKKEYQIKIDFDM